VLRLEGATDGAIPFALGTLIAAVLAIAFFPATSICSVAWTDALQALIMITTATIAVLLVVSGLGGFGELFGRVSE
jgi:solute:Na+ symporter, SSS family